MSLLVDGSIVLSKITYKHHTKAYKFDVNTWVNNKVLPRLCRNRSYMESLKVKLQIQNF